MLEAILALTLVPPSGFVRHAGSWRKWCLARLPVRSVMFLYTNNRPFDVFSKSYYAASWLCHGFVFICAQSDERLPKKQLWFTHRVSLVKWLCVSCVCVCVRLVSLVVRLREWAHRSLLEEEERPDSFMERFRGPELRMAPSRNSTTQDANGNDAKGNFRFVRVSETLLCALIYSTLHWEWCSPVLQESYPHRHFKGRGKRAQHFGVLIRLWQFWRSRSEIWPPVKGRSKHAGDSQAESPLTATSLYFSL